MISAIFSFFNYASILLTAVFSKLTWVEVQLDQNFAS